MVVGKRPLAPVLLAIASGLAALACAILPRGVPAGTPASVPSSERVAVLQRIGAQLEAASSPSGLADSEAILRAFRENTAFEASGTSPDGSIWARFAGGPMVVVPPDPPAAQVAGGGGRAASPQQPIEVRRTTSSAAARASRIDRAPSAEGGLPASDVAIMMDALGGGYGQYGAVVGAWLNANGYEARIVEPTVDNLKAVREAGVFYFGTHGGLGCTGTAASCRESWRTRRGGADLQEPFTEWSYSLWTSTPVTDANESAYAEDVRSGRLGYMLARFLPEGDPEWHYAINIDFIRAYMSFSGDSLVFLDACGSFDEDLKFGFGDKGASLFVGWTEPIAPELRSRYYFDRMLGVNEIRPEGVPRPEPPNRPFDYEAVLQAMEDFGLDSWKSHRTVLNEGDGGEFQWVSEDYVSYLRAERMSGGFSILLPSIRWLLVDESQELLTLEGEFGSEKGRVEIDGQDVQILDWGPEKIRVRLPAADQPGGSGEVIVRVRDHESNAVPLTVWHGTWTYTEGPYLPEIWYYLRFDLYWRADIHPFREIPDEKPYPADPVEIEAASGSTAVWECSASGEIGGVSISGTGSGELPRNQAEGVGFQVLARLHPETRAFEAMTFHAQTDPESICFSTATGYGVNIEQTVDFTFLPVLEQPLEAIRLDDDMVIQGDERPLIPDIADWPTLAWPDIRPGHPPDGEDTEAREPASPGRPGARLSRYRSLSYRFRTGKAAP